MDRVMYYHLHNKSPQQYEKWLMKKTNQVAVNRSRKILAHNVIHHQFTTIYRLVHLISISLNINMHRRRGYQILNTNPIAVACKRYVILNEIESEIIRSEIKNT